MSQPVGIVTGSESATLTCTTQEIPTMIMWEKQDGTLPDGSMITNTTMPNVLVSSLLIPDINSVDIGGMYRCVASFNDQVIHSSFALLNVTGNVCFFVCYVYSIKLHGSMYTITDMCNVLTNRTVTIFMHAELHDLSSERLNL